MGDLAMAERPVSLLAPQVNCSSTFNNRGTHELQLLFNCSSLLRYSYLGHEYETLPTANYCAVKWQCGVHTIGVNHSEQHTAALNLVSDYSD